MYAQNVPLLGKKKTFFKSKDPVKTYFYEDIYRAVDRREAEAMLEETFAEEELISHLQTNYGQIEDYFFINYSPEKIISRVSNDRQSMIAKDETSAIESPQNDEESFEVLLAMAETKSKASSKEEKFDPSEILDQKRIAQVEQEISKKERNVLGLDKPIKRECFIKFKDYESKLQMMDTALFLFGMKLYRQDKSIEFFDADFSNTITVNSPMFAQKTLYDCMCIINEALTLSGFSGELLEVGELKDIHDFDMQKIVVRKKISCRFNSFSQALEAFNCLQKATHMAWESSNAQAVTHGRFAVRF